jgi:hypothetical protein
VLLEEQFGNRADRGVAGGREGNSGSEFVNKCIDRLAERPVLRDSGAEGRSVSRDLLEAIDE